MRKRRLAAIFILIGAICCVRPAEARNFDEFADDFSPTHFSLDAGPLTLTLKGELEIEMHDIQGSGGEGNDSPTDTRTIGTRSLFVEMDSFWLAPRLSLGSHIVVNSILEFTTSNARLGAAWIGGTFTWPETIEHQLEVGLHTPFIKIDRRSERYPIIGTVYWREAEFHINYDGFWRLGKESGVELGLSLGLMRPLAFSPVQESTSFKGTINVLTYGPARPFSGNAPFFGGKVGGETHGFFATAFGFVGQLAAEAGTDELRNNFVNYQDLPGYNAEDALRQDQTFYWGGARLMYHRFGIHAVVEGIASGESLLQRYGAYGQLSYEIHLRAFDKIFHTIEPLFRYEIYRILGTTDVQANGHALRSPAPSNAVTWDFNVATWSLICVIYRDVLRLRVEYYWITEDNGVPALDIANVSFDNNEFMVQIEVRF